MGDFMDGFGTATANQMISSWALRSSMFDPEICAVDAIPELFHASVTMANQGSKQYYW